MDKDTMNGLIGAGGNAAGALLGQVGQYFLNRQEFNLQKELFDYQNAYNNPSKQVERLRSAGITPAAAAQAVVGSSPNQSVPSAVSSHSGIPVPLGSAYHEGKVKASEYLQRIAERKEVEQKMDFNPLLWQSQIDDAKSRMFKNFREGDMFAGQKRYYDEFADTLKEKRPWEIDTLRVGLVNLRQLISESISRVHLNYEQAELEPFKRAFMGAQTEESYNRSYNLGQQGFALMWDNQCRADDFNPNSDLWHNLGRLAATRPKMALRYLDNFTEMTNDIDNRLQQRFGKNYKRNIGLGAGVYLLDRYLGQRKDRKLRRLEHFTNLVTKFIPFTSPTK